MSDNTRTCGCVIQQKSPIIYNSVAFQNSSNFIYESKKELVTNSRNGTLGPKATGNTIFKSDFERMQYLLGAQQQASCGVAEKAFALGTN